MSKLTYVKDEKFLDNSWSHTQPGIEIDPTADVHPNAFFRGKVTVGAYTQIEAGVVIAGDNVLIGHHTIIKTNSTLRGTMTIGNNVMICEQVNIEGGRPGDYIGGAISAVPDKAIVGDSCIIGPGSAMHGTTFGENCVVGMRCAFDYNTRIGKGCVLVNGTATNVDQIIPDNTIVEGVPSIITKRNISDFDRKSILGFIPAEQADKMSYRLEERYKLGFKQSDLAKKTKLDIAPDAYVHPTAILEGNIKIGSNTVVDAGSILLGDIVIGSNSKIAINAVIKGGVDIGDKTFIMGHALVDALKQYGVDILMKDAHENIKIGSGCYLEQGSAIRGTTLEDGAVIGQISTCDFGSFVQKGGVVASGSAVCAGAGVPAGSFVEGLPTKVIKKDISNENLLDFFGFIPSELINQTIPQQASKRASKASIKNIDIHPNTRIEANVWFEGNVKISEYTWVDSGAVFCGDVEIGYNSLIRCNISFDGEVKIGKQTHVYDQVSFEGKCSVGDNCWINHGCIIKCSAIGNDSAVAVGAACGYNSVVEDGAIVCNKSVAYANHAVRRNSRVEGIPSVVTKKFMTLEDRQLYFGVSPFLWTQAQGGWIVDEIKERRKK